MSSDVPSPAGGAGRGPVCGGVVVGRAAPALSVCGCGRMRRRRRVAPRGWWWGDPVGAVSPGVSPAAGLHRPADGSRAGGCRVAVGAGCRVAGWGAARRWGGGRLVWMGAAWCRGLRCAQWGGWTDWCPVTGRVVVAQWGRSGPGRRCAVLAVGAPVHRDGLLRVGAVPSTLHRCAAVHWLSRIGAECVQRCREEPTMEPLADAAPARSARTP
jgi:hypothetical protein